MTGDSSLELLRTPKPSFSTAEVEALVAERYDISGELSELGGERDQNFRVNVPDGGSYVLKISNPKEDSDALDFQTEAIHHILRTDPDLPVMEPVPTTAGESWTTIEGDSGTTYFVRVFIVVPGREITADGLDDDALFAYGKTIARMGQALQGFYHPDAQYDILWDLRNTPDRRSQIDLINDADLRAVAERALDRFEDRVQPVFETLRAQVIHNDLTLNNVLFDSNDRVSGIVDFGDLTHTALVCDLAIPLARVMVGQPAPVSAAKRMIEGYVSVQRLQKPEARLLGDLVLARLVAVGAIGAWQSERQSGDGEYYTASTESLELLQELDSRGFDEVGRQLQTATKSANVPYSSMGREELLSRRRDVLGPSPLFYSDPVHFVDGEGVWLFDSSGNRYLDAYNNVQVVGHSNPAVTAAISGQTRKLTTHSRYLHESPVELAERLVAKMPDELDTVIPVNSGSEANDIAWRLAQTATGQEGAIVTDHAYHGITQAVSALSPMVWENGSHPSHIKRIAPPVETGGADGVTATDPVGAISDAVNALDDQEVGTAGFVFDPLFTSDGIYPPDGNALRRAADVVREAGGLIIADEVQAGFGRCGSELWGFETVGIEPDVVTLGKPMGNGQPVAAVVTRSDIAEATMEDSTVFSTFGGNPVSSAAALAVLDVIEEQELLEHVTKVGKYLDNGLKHVLANQGGGEVRSRGLMFGVQLDDSATGSGGTEAVVDDLCQNGVLMGTAGPAGDTLKIRPPLIFEREHADILLETLDAVLEQR